MDDDDDAFETKSPFGAASSASVTTQAATGGSSKARSRVVQRPPSGSSGAAPCGSSAAPACPPPGGGVAARAAAALIIAPAWLDGFRTYLSSLGISTSNVRSTMKVVTALAGGQGIAHPDGVTPHFCAGTRVDISDDLDRLKQASADWLPPKDDSSRGWKVRHPLSKLIQYKATLAATASTPAGQPTTGAQRPHNDRDDSDDEDDDDVPLSKRENVPLRQRLVEPPRAAINVPATAGTDVGLLHPSSMRACLAEDDNDDDDDEEEDVPLSRRPAARGANCSRQNPRQQAPCGGVLHDRVQSRATTESTVAASAVTHSRFAASAYRVHGSPKMRPAPPTGPLEPHPGDAPSVGGVLSQFAFAPLDD
jgi:hypothetical protein